MDTLAGLLSFGFLSISVLLEFLVMLGDNGNNNVLMNLLRKILPLEHRYKRHEPLLWVNVLSTGH
jgi:hypothetical protein